MIFFICMNSVRHFHEISSHIYNLNNNEIILLKLFGKSIANQCCCFFVVNKF